MAIVNLVDALSRRRSETRLRRLAKAFVDHNFRHAFMGRQLRAFLAQQIRTLRGEKQQKEFGELIGKPQSVVSRLEKQKDKNISIQTLIDIAERLDIAVVIRFVDFPTFLRYTEDLSDSAARPASYSQEAVENVVDELEGSPSEQVAGALKRQWGVENGGSGLTVPPPVPSPPIDLKAA